MRIIKFNDGFITNSSTLSGVVILAKKKNVLLSVLLDKAGLSNEHLVLFEEESENWTIEDFDIEIDHLTDEYDILLAEYTLGVWGDDYEPGYYEDARIKQEQGLYSEFSSRSNAFKWNHPEISDFRNARIKISDDDLILLRITEI